jgi:hypothetical protein
MPHAPGDLIRIRSVTRPTGCLRRSPPPAQAVRSGQGSSSTSSMRRSRKAVSPRSQGNPVAQGERSRILPSGRTTWSPGSEIRWSLR